MRVILICFFVFCALSAVAAQIDNLYIAKVPVADQTNTVRAQGIREAFLQVLVRVTGQDSVRTNEYVLSFLPKAPSFVQQFSYGRDDEDGWSLIVKFDKEAILNFLADAQLPVWQSNRPLVMLWLATEQRYERSIIAEHSQYGRVVTERAERRALPVVLPLMDLEDTTAIEVSDVWGRFMQPVMTASMRYHPDVVVAAQFREDSTQGWIVRGQMYFDDRMFTLAASADSFERAVDNMLAAIAAQISRRYAILPNSANGNLLYIRFSTPDILTLAKVENYLEGLLPIQSVHVAELSDAGLVFRLRLAGSEKALLEAIELDGVMELTPTPEVKPDERKTYLGTWNGSQ